MDHNGGDMDSVVKLTPAEAPGAVDIALAGAEATGLHGGEV